MKAEYTLTKLRLFFVLLESLLFLLFIESCKNDAPTEANNNSTFAGTSVSLQDKSLDLDGDGKIDYLFEYYGAETATIPPSRWEGVYVYCLDSNQVQNSLVTGTTPLRDSVLISDSSGWNSYSESLGGAGNNISFWSGSFVGSDPENLGIRLSRQGLYYYGWVKLSIAKNGSLSIVDSAYNITANKPILAGVHP